MESPASDGEPLDSVLSTPTISPEYETMCECCPKLVTLIRQSPKSIGNALFARHFLAPNVRNFVNDRMVSETDKAQRLVDTMTDRIQHYPNSFNDFIDVLEKEGPWTNDMVKELRDLYKAKTVCVVDGDQLSDDVSSEDSFHTAASELDEVCRVSLAPKSIASLQLESPLRQQKRILSHQTMMSVLKLVTMDNRIAVKLLLVLPALFALSVKYVL